MELRNFRSSSFLTEGATYTPMTTITLGIGPHSSCYWYVTRGYCVASLHPACIVLLRDRGVMIEQLAKSRYSVAPRIVNRFIPQKWNRGSATVPCWSTTLIALIDTSTPHTTITTSISWPSSTLTWFSQFSSVFSSIFFRKRTSGISGRPGDRHFTQPTISKHWMEQSIPTYYYEY